VVFPARPPEGCTTLTLCQMWRRISPILVGISSGGPSPAWWKMLLHVSASPRRWSTCTDRTERRLTSPSTNWRTRWPLPPAPWSPTGSSGGTGWPSGRPTAPSGSSQPSAQWGPVRCWSPSIPASRGLRRPTSCASPGPECSSPSRGFSTPTIRGCWTRRWPRARRSPSSSGWSSSAPVRPHRGV
jgi:hypothetical protein